MRLLFLNERVDYASATSYSIDLASALMERGHRVQLCTTGGQLAGDFRTRGVETYVAKFNLFAFRKLLQYLRDYDADIVHVQSLRSVPFARRIASRLGKPVMVTVHTRPVPDAPVLDDSNLCGAIAVNEVIREALVNDQNLPKNSVRVIRRGVDLQGFSPAEEEPWRGEGDRLPVIGSVGRLQRDKGHQVLIRAARRIIDAGCEAHFAVVGDGPQEPELRRLVHELDLRLSVTFSAHIAARQDLFRLFDIVAAPVLKTGVAVTAIEAMAMRKPLIASGVGEMLHIVQDGVTGHLVPEGDDEFLAAKILEVLRNPDEMRAVAARARAWVEKNFALEPMVDATVEFYEDALRDLEEGRALEAARR